MSEATMEVTVSAPEKIPDKVRIKRAAKYHGQRAMAYLAVFAAMEAWVLASDGLVIAKLLSIVAAWLAGSYLAGVFHEWGHFTGARLSGSYSPAVRKVTGLFMFGFSMEKNSPQQFLAMSLGGPTANWLLVLLVALFIPLDNVGGLALLATVFGRAVAVVIFEGPVMYGVLQGGEPQDMLDRRIETGALDRSGTYGHIIAAATFIAGLLLL